MRPFATLPDYLLLALMRSGKQNGARPFLRHPQVMIQLREECMRRDLMPLCDCDLKDIARHMANL